MPKRRLQEFFKACKKGDNVIIPDRVLSDARFYFQLNSKRELLEYILSEGELGNIIFENTGILEDNPCPEKEIIFDAYHIESGMKYIYLAFFKSIWAGWVIKSFKPDDERDPRNIF